jgi:hypothetical protein
MAFQIDNLPADQLRMALSVNLYELPEEEALAVRDFIRRIGGRQNAMAAVDLMEEIERTGYSGVIWRRTARAIVRPSAADSRQCR